MSVYEVRRGEHVVSDDPARIDLALVHGFLTTSYWSPGITVDEVRRSIEHSHPFGLYRSDRQVGFARVVTDTVKMAYLADVFVVPEARGQGLGVFLVESLLAHPGFAGVWGWMLLTSDAHALYARFGFTAPDRPERVMTWRRRQPSSAGASAPVASSSDASPDDPSSSDVAASPAPSSGTARGAPREGGGSPPKGEIVEMGGEPACRMHLLADPEG
jgi:GNAT superfamily N-acetyltransferase